MRHKHTTILVIACFLLAMTAAVATHAQTTGYAPTNLQEFAERVAGSRINMTSGSASVSYPFTVDGRAIVLRIVGTGEIVHARYTYLRTSPNTATLTLTGGFFFLFRQCQGPTMGVNFTSMFSGTAQIPAPSDQDDGGVECTGTFEFEGASVPSFEGEVIDGLRFVEDRTILDVTLPQASGDDIPLIYSLNPSLPAGLSFNRTTRVLSGTPTAPHSRSPYTYTVTDENGDTDSLTFTIEIVANPAPSFDSATISDQHYVENRAIASITLPPAIGGDPPLTYSLIETLPAGLTFDPSSRVLSGTPTEPYPSTAYTYTVEDENGDRDELTFRITVQADSMPRFEYLVDDLELYYERWAIPDRSYVENVAIESVTLPPAIEGDAPLTYSLSPPLPAGLTFNPSTRVLSGTPTEGSSTTTYTYTVEDEDGDRDELTFSITVLADAMPSFGSETIADQSYMENAPITSITLPPATGGDAPLTYSLNPALPEGLTFNSSTRVLSGTPTEGSSTTTYTYTVEDEDGDRDELTFSITVLADAMPSFGSETIADQSYMENAPITSITLPPATGGDAPLTYSLNPALPEGLTFNSSTRVLSGTPTETSQARTYTYMATDQDGDRVRLTFDIAIAADAMPTFGNRTIDDQIYAQNMAITNVTLPAATGGDTPLTYSLSPTLPSGLTFNSSTRVLSGTPTVGTPPMPYTYTVTDEDGDTDALTFTIHVDAIPRFAVRTLDVQSFVDDDAVTSITLPPASGGDAPLSYSLSPSLPAGLTFDPSTRVMSGTATSHFPEATYTYTVTDDNGDTDELTFAIVKLGAPSAPQNLRATPGDRQVSLQWREPASDGGSPITRYDYQVDERPWVSTGGTATSHVVRNLVNGTNYTFRVRAVNSVSEDSPSSESVSAADRATPTAGEEVKEAVTETVEAVTAATAANITANIGTRFSATPSSGSVVVVGGRTLNLGASSTSSERLATAGSHWDSLENPSRIDETWSPGADDLLRSSAFEIALNAADDGDEMAAGAAHWTVWGRGDLQFFESRPERGATYDGDLRAGYLGIDARLGDRWLAGVAVSRTNAEADYDTGGDGAAESGSLEVELTGVHPYVRYVADARSELWTILGAGRGEIENSSTGETSRETSDMRMLMGAVGIRHSLDPVESLNFAYLSDVGFARVETDDGLEAIDGLTVDTWRLRMGVEASHTAELESGAALTSFAEVAGRFDGGGDEDEVGLEISPGFYLSAPSAGIGVEVRGRFLALHSAENYEERGLSATVSLSPRPGELGLSLSLSPRWGAPTGDAETLWRDHTLERLDSGAARHDSLSFDARLGYGLRSMNGLLTPFGELGVRDEDSRRLRVGAQFTRQSTSLGTLSVELAGERRDGAWDDSEHRVGLVGRLRF